MFKKKMLLSFLLIAAIIIIPTFSVLAVSVQGGEWTYGGHHELHNWGAFSNYYHPDRYHWSYVESLDRSNSNKGYADAGYTSHAYINTWVGERCAFDFGF